MNYKKIYDQIIDRAKNRSLTDYCEKHHIIPKCMGGSDDSSNIVKLTAREHFLCHWILHELYPNDYKLMYAFDKMSHIKSNSAKQYVPSSKIVEYAREEMARLSAGSNNPFYGKKHSKEIIDRIKLKVIGYKHSEESKSKMGRSRYGKDNPQFGKPSTQRKKVIGVENNIIFDSVKDAGLYFGITSAAIIYRIKKGNLKYYKL